MDFNSNPIPCLIWFEGLIGYEIPGLQNPTGVVGTSRDFARFVFNNMLEYVEKIGFVAIN